MPNEYLNILVKVNKETGELDVVKQQLSDVDGIAQKTSKSTGELSSAFNFLKMALPIASIGGLIALFKESINLAERHAEVVRGLNFALSSQGLEVNNLSKEIQEYSEHVQRTTRFDSEDFISSLTKTINKVGDVTTSMRIVNAAMGMSTKGVMSFDTALYLLQMGITGQPRAMFLMRKQLQAYVDDSKSATENTKNLINKFEGLATDTDSITAKTAQMHGVLNDFKKLMGQDFSPIFAEGLKKITDVAKDFAKSFLIIQGTIDKMTLSVMEEKVKLYDKEMKTNIKTLTEYSKAEDNYSVTLSHNNALKDTSIKQLKEGAELASQNKSIEEDRIRQLKAQMEANQLTLNSLIELDNQKKESAKIPIVPGDPKLTEVMLNQQMEMNQAYQVKLDELENTAAANRRKIIIKEYQEKKKLLKQNNTDSYALEKWYTEAISKNDKEQVIEKMENAKQVFEITQNFVNAGLTLLGEEFKKKKGWAIAMIALEKSVAIMSAIQGAMTAAAATGNPALAWTMAASQIALITAQAVQQVKNLNESSNIDTSSVSVGGVDNNSNPLQTEQHNFGGQAVNIGNGGFSQGSESGKNIINVHFNVIDPTSLTTDAQEKMGRWLKNVLDNENKR